MKKMMLVTLFMGILCQMAFAQDLDKAKLDSYFNALEENNKFMGSVAVSKNGKIIYTKTIGFSDVETKTKANVDSKYRIGSISKTFTTVLVLKAVEEKKLDLNQTIEKFFPSIKNTNKITIKHLLQHRSGIHNFTDDATYMTYHTKAKTEQEMIEIISSGGMDFEPDTKASYSNSNFVLLTYILERTYKKTYSELIAKYITKPLKLKNTYFGGKIKLADNECDSYQFSGGWKEEAETDMSIPQGAGSIVSSPSDLVKFSDALFGGKLLKKESVELMKTLKDRYGLGLFMVPFFDKVGYGHNGGIDGFTSVFCNFTDGNVSYALVSNGTNFDNNSISIAVLSAVYNKPYDIPSFKTITLKSEELDPYLGVYASKEMPLKITISKDNLTLVAQGTGQASFPLEATDKDKFKFDPAGIVLEFNPAQKTMILKQGGAAYSFTKE